MKAGLSSRNPPASDQFGPSRLTCSSTYAVSVVDFVPLFSEAGGLGLCVSPGDGEAV